LLPSQREEPMEDEPPSSSLAFAKCKGKGKSDGQTGYMPLL